MAKGRYLIFFAVFLTLIHLNASDIEIEKAVQKLGHESFKVRKQATKDLLKMIEKDEAVAEKLQKFSNHKDPEIRMRIKEILKEQLTGLKWMDPANEKKMKSGTSGKAVKLEFINKSKQDIKIHWVDWSGQRKPWRGKIEPGGSQICERSFEGHVWLVTDANDKGLGIYVLGDEDSRIIFKGVPGKK